MVISDELNEELNNAALATSQAYVNARNVSSGELTKPVHSSRFDTA